MQKLAALGKPGSPAYIEGLAEYAKLDYWVFKRLVLQEQWMDPFLHGDVIIQFCEDHNWEGICLLLPRGCGKTGCVTQTLPAWLAARDPQTSGYICNAREDKAEKFAQVSANTISGNKLYKAAFPDVQISGRWSPSKGFFLKRPTERVDPTIGSVGIKGNITSAHVEYLVIDDAINREMSKFPKQVHVAEDFFNESINCLNPGGSMVVCGTRWVMYDYYGKLESGELLQRDGSPMNVLKLGAEREYKNANGDWEVEIIFPEKSFFDFGVEKRVGYSRSFLEGKKKSESDLYSALYCNEPVSVAQRQFDCDNVETFSSVEDLPFPIGKVGRVGIECESQGNALLSAIRIMMNTQGHKIPLERLTTKRIAKAERIRSTLQPPISDCQFRMLDRLWQGRDNLGEELRTYDKGHDDCLDACTHAITMMRDNGRYAEVVIAVDPAFTTKGYSDYTAIVAGCRMNNVIYILECLRFKTSRVDVIARKIFSVHANMRRLISDQGGGKTRKCRAPTFRGGQRKNESRSKWKPSNRRIEVESRGKTSTTNWNKVSGED